MVIVSVVNMIIVFTGDGKGKTTAALGVVLRALGYGKRVCVVQFFKSWPTGEQRMLRELSRTKPLKFYSFGEKDFIASSKNLAKATFCFSPPEIKAPLSPKFLFISEYKFNFRITVSNFSLIT